MHAYMAAWLKTLVIIPDHVCMGPLVNDADKDTIINDDEKFQLISVKMKNTLYLAYGCSN